MQSNWRGRNRIHSIWNPLPSFKTDYNHHGKFLSLHIPFLSMPLLSLSQLFLGCMIRSWKSPLLTSGFTKRSKKKPQRASKALSRVPPRVLKANFYLFYPPSLSSRKSSGVKTFQTKTHFIHSEYWCLQVLQPATGKSMWQTRNISWYSCMALVRFETW